MEISSTLWDNVAQEALYITFYVYNTLVFKDTDLQSFISQSNNLKNLRCLISVIVMHFPICECAIA